MISNMTGSIDREVTPCQGRLKASADCWLSLAAAPTFAIMALLTGIHGGSMPDMRCSAAGNGFPTERHGPDVFADERLPFAALAEARLQSAKRRPLDLGGINE
jgi:hypothetical protein